MEDWLAVAMERVVVTGMGVDSPLGCSVSEFWEALIAGTSGVRSLEGGIYLGMQTTIGAAVQDMEGGKYFDAKDARRTSRSSGPQVFGKTPI